MTIIFIMMAATIIVCGITIAICCISNRKIKKQFEEKLFIEREYRRCLENHYMHLYESYKEHLDKHH